jgi:negative regulator of sigma E activity
VRLHGILLAALCALGPAAVHAQSAEALTWLRKIHDATQKLSYTRTFIYQNNNRSETSRITRYVDASGDIEKLRCWTACRARSCAPRTRCAATSQEKA